MGWRFRKSTKIGPFRLNYSKKGIGWSVGAGGIRYTHRADGRRTVTSTIRGTGLSYTTELGPTKKQTKKQPMYVNTRADRAKEPGQIKWYFGCVCIILGVCFLSFLLETLRLDMLFLGCVCIMAGVLLLKNVKRQRDRLAQAEADKNEMDTMHISLANQYTPPAGHETYHITVNSKQNAEILAPQLLKQAKETADILNQTTNPDTFFSRYDFLIGRLKTLCACEDYISFTGETPSVTLARVGTKDFYEMASCHLMDRCFGKSCEKMASLKTEKGKQNEADRFNKAFASCGDYLNETLRQYQEEKYKQLLQIASGKAAPASPSNEKSAELEPSPTYRDEETQKQIEQFEQRFDLTTEEGIAAIPESEASHDPGDVVSMPEQILSRKATEYKKAGKLDLAVACLRKANELRGPSFYLYTRDDYERLVDTLIEAGRFEEARAEHKRLDQTLGTREEELRRLQAENCTDKEDRELYEKKVIQPEMEKAKRREQYDWLLENLPGRAPKSFSAYCRMKKQNTATYQKICAAAKEKGTDLETVRFWT